MLVNDFFHENEDYLYVFWMNQWLGLNWLINGCNSKMGEDMDQRSIQWTKLLNVMDQ